MADKKGRLRMKSFYIKLIICAAMLGILTAESGAAPLSAGKEAFDFTLETLSGQEITLSEELKTKRAVLVFFATWCPHCGAVVPSTNAFSKKYAADVRVIGIDVQESKSKVEDFVKRTQMAYDVVIDATGVVANRYGISGIPTVIVIDKNNKVLYRGTSITDMEKRVEF